MNYVGLDISQSVTAICICDKDGVILREAMVPTEPEKISEYLKRSNLEITLAGIESSNPRKFASGEVDYNGRITKCGDTMLRTHLFESAAYTLRPSSKRTDLKIWGMRVAKRSCLKKARVAVSRRLAIIMHRMWIDGTEYEAEKKSAV